MFVTRLVGRHNIFTVILDNQATLYVFKNEALESNIRANRKANTGGINGCQTGMSTVQVCAIPYVVVWFFNEHHLLV